MGKAIRPGGSPNGGDNPQSPSFRGWLYTIADRVRIDWLRRQGLVGFDSNSIGEPVVKRLNPSVTIDAAECVLTVFHNRNDTEREIIRQRFWRPSTALEPELRAELDRFLARPRRANLRPSLPLAEYLVAPLVGEGVITLLRELSATIPGATINSGHKVCAKFLADVHSCLIADRDIHG